VPFRRAFGQLFTQDTTIAWVVFWLVAAALIVAFVLSWYRNRTGKAASRKSTANRVEITYLAALTGMAVFLVISSFAANAKDFPSSDPKPAMRVQVTAFQWCWRFRYTGQPVTVTARCQGGPLPTLVLPTGRPVELDVTSTDVVHAFWVPYLREKMYAYPGQTNKFTVTLADTGRWIGRCAQLCGLYHYEMDFYLKAVPPSQFDQWLRAHNGSASAGGGA
jgi:heme/copper-type cytochrome/quinol oxidase subunit 2